MEYIRYMLVYLMVLVAIWGIDTIFANSVSDHKVITPEEGVKCIIVSRMFNTSVDCWKE